MKQLWKMMILVLLEDLQGTNSLLTGHKKYVLDWVTPIIMRKQSHASKINVVTQSKKQKQAEKGANWEKVYVQAFKLRILRSEQPPCLSNN